jgi:hypothetical protein
MANYDTCPQCGSRCDDQVCECPPDCPTNKDIPAREDWEDNSMYKSVTQIISITANTPRGNVSNSPRTTPSIAVPKKRITKKLAKTKGGGK